MKLSAKHLRKLCLTGVLSTERYWKLAKKRKLHTKKIRYTRIKFDLSGFNDEECLLLFRFNNLEMRRLNGLLQIPKLITLPNKNRCPGMEAFAIFFRRLSYPNRLWDLVPLFKRDISTLSRIFHATLLFLYEKWGWRLRLMRHNATRNDLQEFASTCSSAGSYYPNVIGFIDGTMRSICRPTHNQKHNYSGYKKTHCVKYQSIVFPNGLIGRLDGPYAGRRHDAAILGCSNVRDEFIELLLKEDGSNYCVFGDAGYAHDKFIKTGFKKHVALTSKQLEFNRVTSGLRVSVEYGFGK